MLYTFIILKRDYRSVVEWTELSLSSGQINSDSISQSHQTSKNYWKIVRYSFRVWRSAIQQRGTVWRLCRVRCSGGQVAAWLEDKGSIAVAWPS